MRQLLVGLRLCDGTADSGALPYKYNGKELDGMHGLCSMPYAENYNTRENEFTLNPFSEHSVDSFTQSEINQYVPDVKGIHIMDRKIWEQYGRKEK